MSGCIIQNLNFTLMVQAKKFVFKEEVDPEIWNKIMEIHEITENIKKSKIKDHYFTPEENDTLLELNKYCRNIWTNYFKRGAFEFDKEFSTKKLLEGATKVF